MVEMAMPVMMGSALSGQRGGSCDFRCSLSVDVFGRMGEEGAVKAEALNLATADRELNRIDPIGIYSLFTSEHTFRNKVTDEVVTEKTLISPEWKESIAVWTAAGENGIGTPEEYQAILSRANALASTEGAASMFWISPAATKRSDGLPEHRGYSWKKNEEGEVTAYSYQFTGSSDSLFGMLNKLSSEAAFFDSYSLFWQNENHDVSHGKIFSAYESSLSFTEQKSASEYLDRFRQETGLPDSILEERVSLAKENYQQKLTEAYLGDIESAVKSVVSGFLSLAETVSETPEPAFERIIESISIQPSVYSSDGISVIRDDINNDSPFSLRTVYKIVENSYDKSERKERTTFLKQLKTDTHYSPEELEKRNAEIKHFVHEYVDKVLSDEISFSAIGLVGQSIAELARKVSAKIEVDDQPREVPLLVLAKDHQSSLFFQNYFIEVFDSQVSKHVTESANDHKFPPHYSLITETMEDTDKSSPSLLLGDNKKNSEGEKEKAVNSVRKSIISDEKILSIDNTSKWTIVLNHNGQNKRKMQQEINPGRYIRDNQSIKTDPMEFKKREREEKDLSMVLFIGMILLRYETFPADNNTKDESNLQDGHYIQGIEESTDQTINRLDSIKEIHSLVIPAVVLLIEEIIEEGKAEADSTVFSPVTGESVLMLSGNDEEPDPDFEEVFWEDLLLTIALTDFINIANQRERSYRDKSQEDKIFSDIFITPEEENSALQGENGEKSHSILKLELFLKELSELINEDETEGKVDVRTENQKDKELENHALHQEIMTLDLKILIELIKQDQEIEMINDTMISLLIFTSAYKSSYFYDRARRFLSLFTLKESEQVFPHRHNKEDVTSENELLLNKFLTVLNTNSVVEFLSQKNNLLEKEIDPHERILEELKEYQNKHLLNNNKQSEKSKESKFDSEDDSELKAINIMVLLLLLEMKQKKINFKELELSKHQPHHSAKDVLIRLYKIFNTLGYQRGEQELLLNILGTSQDTINDWIKLRIEVQSVNQKANNKLLKLERNLFCRIWLNRMVGNILRSNKNKKKKAVSGSVQIFGTFCLCGLIFRYKPLALNIIDVSEYSIITSN